MPKKNTLSKSERLNSGNRMNVLFSEGRRGYVGPLRFCWVATAMTDSAAHNMRRPEAAVSVLFSVPKKAFKRAWKRNLLKRRMRESYRQRKHELLAAVEAAGQHIDIALICTPPMEKASKKDPKGAKSAKRPAVGVPPPDFKTIDNAISNILGKILARS